MDESDRRDVIDRILTGSNPMEAAGEASTKQKAAAVERVRELAAQYRGTFNTPAGRAVLAHLRSVTVDQSVFVPGITYPGADGLSAEQQGFMREGQNSIVREIERYIAWEDPET